MAIPLVAVVVWATQPAPTAKRADETTLAGLARLHREAQAGLMRQPVSVAREKLMARGGEGAREIRNGPAQQDYADRAFPRRDVTYTQVQRARTAFSRLPETGSATAVRENAAAVASVMTASRVKRKWQELGPFVPTVPAPNSNFGRPTTNSGRVTGIAVDSHCSSTTCRVWVAAAGGGVWRTDNGYAARPHWVSSSSGLTSNATGSIVQDPTDRSGNTIYLGTGEPNGSGDSEAGVGLFKSTNGGRSWRLVPASVPVSKDRSIAAIEINPSNGRHIWIGTALARHGSASVNGGRRTPPGAPTLGIYETRNGGRTWALIFSLPPNPTPPGQGTGTDWFQGGVNHIQLDPKSRGVYAAIFGYGIWRKAPRLDGDQNFHQVFQTYKPDDTFGDRTEFDIAHKNGKSRIYVGDSATDPDDPNDPNAVPVSQVWRTDDANRPAAALLGATKNNAGWTPLSNPTPGTPGYTSWKFCQSQCGYDIFVGSPPGRPDDVWIGGQTFYEERGGPSNGRVVLRSTNAGALFTDMTNDTRTPPESMHPDSQAIAFAPRYPDRPFIGSDGGVVRTNGTFADDSAECDGRNLNPASLATCKLLLSKVPGRIDALNAGLRTLQFQSLSINPRRPTTDVLGGTQDNGTWAFSGGRLSWFESILGDGGQSGHNAANHNVKMHTFFGPTPDVSFRGTEPLGWNVVYFPLLLSGEAASFYVPLIADPSVANSWFVGLQHVWRTQDNGGDQAFLEQFCNEFTGTFPANVTCGDWVPLGGAVGSPAGDLTSTAYGADRAGQFVVATERAPQDSGTLWAGTRTGRVFISKNANAADANAVTYTRIDLPTAGRVPGTPGRFVSGISIDSKDANHAFVSFTGYDAYTPGDQPGHVFEVRYNPATGTATWTNRSHDLGDQPILSVRHDSKFNLYASTDFGVLYLPRGGRHWLRAGSGLPPVATYGLTIDPARKVLYAATHGRGAWRLPIG